MLANYLRERDVQAEIVTLSGAVEIAPRLGRADLICDLVSTGSTLQANHLREVETVLESHAVLIRTPLALAPEKDEWVERLLMRIEGVQQVRESKYIMLHAPRSALAGDPQPAARQRVADHHSARRLPGQSRGARRVPRERVLGNAREPEEGRRQRAARAAGREDAGLSHAHPRLERSSMRRAGAPRLRAPRRSRARTSCSSAREIVDDGAPRRRRRACARTRSASTACELDELAVSRAEFAAARRALTPEEIAALERAIENVRAFHEAQLPGPLSLETMPGVRCERVDPPDSAVGLYVPAGVAPLPSAVIMLAVPAQLAGCPRACSARRRRRTAARTPAVLVAARAVRHRDGVQGRRRAGDRRHGLRHAEHSEGRQDLRSRQRVRHRRQAARRDGSGRRGARSARRASEVLVIADDAASRRVRRGRPARAGRARHAGPGDSRHDVARARGGGARGSGRADARAVPPRDSREVASPAAAASSCRDLDTAIAVATTTPPST